MNKSIISTVCAALLCATNAMLLTSAKAATLGQVDAGRTYAETHCASCHSIARDGNTSPVNAATPFQLIAATPGMGRTALFVFFRSPHPTMPNLIIRGDNLDNIIAYILSLKPKN